MPTLLRLFLKLVPFCVLNVLPAVIIMFLLVFGLFHAMVLLLQTVQVMLFLHGEGKIGGHRNKINQGPTTKPVCVVFKR